MTIYTWILIVIAAVAIIAALIVKSKKSS